MICINDKFSPEQWEIWNKYGIQVPKEGEEYSVRKELITRNGKAFLLNEIINPLIPATESGFSFEPSWAISRFQIEETIEELESVELEEEMLV